MIPPIRVYPPDYTEFTTNGLCCLSPSSSEVTLKEKEAHSIHLEHPIDSSGAWKYLKMSYILYVPIKERGRMTFQPMRIYQISKKRSGNTASISVDARHVFYDLNYTILQDVRPTQLNGRNAIEWVLNNSYRPTASKQAVDNFTFDSNIAETGTAYYQYKTVTAALIGENNCISNVWNGELYVDGFYFSINRRKENAVDNAFNLRYGFNLTGITATYSSEKSYSALIGKSNSNQILTGSVPAESLQLPFDKVQYAQFSYGNDSDPAQFGRDFNAYLDNATKISATYQINFADLGQTEEYKDIRNLESCEVGDTGIVYDEELEINVLEKIVEKKIDVLTQKTKSIMLGNSPASITEISRFTNTVSVSDSIVQKNQSYTEEQIKELQTPKKSASGGVPLEFTAETGLPVEYYKLYGNTGGVGDKYGDTYRITFIVNGSNATVVSLPYPLGFDDYIERNENGVAVAHYSEHGDFDVEALYIPVRRGRNAITTNTAVSPSRLTVTYR